MLSRYGQSACNFVHTSCMYTVPWFLLLFIRKTCTQFCTAFVIKSIQNVCTFLSYKIQQWQPTVQGVCTLSFLIKELTVALNKKKKHIILYFLLNFFFNIFLSSGVNKTTIFYTETEWSFNFQLI